MRAQFLRVIRKSKESRSKRGKKRGRGRVRGEGGRP